MTPELTVLTLAALLQVVQFALMAGPVNKALGTTYTGGPRDEPPTTLPPLAGRLLRALDNHYQALILFTIAVVVVTLSDQSTSVSQTAAWIYLAARVAYVPAYASGIPNLRSLCFFIGFLATLTMLIAALL